MVSRFITCRRYETINLHEILQGISTKDCDWLESKKKGSTAQRVCYSDSLKRRELVEEFLYWYFNSFLIPLLKVRDDKSSVSAAHTRLARTRFIALSLLHIATEFYTLGKTTGRLYANLLSSVLSQ